MKNRGEGERLLQYIYYLLFLVKGWYSYSRWKLHLFSWASKGRRACTWSKLTAS